MGLSGDLKTFFLSSIIQMIGCEKKTGILEVCNNKKKYQIVIKDGDVVYVLWSEQKARIGDLLVSKKLLQKKQLKECLEISKSKKLALGKILVEKKYISLEKLTNILYQQTEERLCNILSWETGEFNYHDSKIDFSRMILIKMDIMSIILEASRRIDEMSILKKKITSKNLVFKISKNMQDLEEIKLNSRELQILFLIDKNKPVSYLLDHLGLDQFSLYKILFTFLSSGLIVKQDGKNSS